MINKNRLAILSVIFRHQNIGISYSGIKKMLNIPDGSFAYHLKLLVSNKFVINKKLDKKLSEIRSLYFITKKGTAYHNEILWRPSNIERFNVEKDIEYIKDYDTRFSDFAYLKAKILYNKDSTVKFNYDYYFDSLIEQLNSLDLGLSKYKQNKKLVEILIKILYVFDINIRKDFKIPISKEFKGIDSIFQKNKDYAMEINSYRYIVNKIYYEFYKIYKEISSDALILDDESKWLKYHTFFDNEFI